MSLIGGMLTALRTRQADVGARRERIERHGWPDVLYVVGDIHGRLDLLIEIERQITSDASAFSGEKLMILLGDYVDRGPESAQVLDHLTSKANIGIDRVCLLGNHEAAMLALLDARNDGEEWLRIGGIETLASYGVDVTTLSVSSPRRLRDIVVSHVPDEHVSFLRNLPVLFALPGLVCAHAGMRPDTRLSDHSDADLTTLRLPHGFEYPNDDLLVVHGHTPMRIPLVTSNRICLDTGAFATGKLFAARILPDRSIKLFEAENVSESTADVKLIPAERRRRSRR